MEPSRPDAYFGPKKSERTLSAQKETLTVNGAGHGVKVTSGLLIKAQRVVVVAHTTELRLTEAAVRQTEGAQTDAPVEQVATTVGLRVAAELHRMWASPCS